MVLQNWNSPSNTGGGPSYRILTVTRLEDNGKIHLWFYLNSALLWVKMALFTPVCMYGLMPDTPESASRVYQSWVNAW
jgi:hypothetical protein